jgi:PPOX class probable F420-dependent enzyme
VAGRAIVAAMSSALPAPGTALGDDVRNKLDHESVVWLTTVAGDGTPQPNPVWFVPESGGEAVLTYNRTSSARVRHVRERPRVALNFNMRAHDADVVVLLGTAEIVDDVPPPDRNHAYVEKYRDGIRGIGMDPASFAAAYPVPIRIRFSRVRGL